ncbi:mechanosensitive ion channel family protein [Polaribacter glomeratus]|uniref:Transporter n=1 Tax=Polaribacter glomeratus TaxID=102 RepID=A0A2S7WIX8_9FLAO|nr:mechanosensitive ion channel domain-containing protein [Polaribacter glomeratus]PQJ77252.1 transporter [Polaribacter glomeratus]TXD65100.1 mechanosensitive ion channel [Polaribacter glomeratus]
MENIEQLYANPLFSRILTIIFGLVIIWFSIRLIQKKLFNKINDIDNRYKAKKIGSFVGYFFTIILIGITFSDKLGGFTVALGVAGAGIAFALQEVIASFAGWLTIMFGGFYKTGDRVQLGGIKGDVMDIGVLRTTIMETGQWVDGDLYNGRIVLVANSFVYKEPVFNYSGDFPFLWDEIKVPVQFGSNYKKATEILENCGKEIVGNLTEKSKEEWAVLQQKYKLEDAQTAPMVSLIANDNWIEFTLRYVVSYKKRRATKTALFTSILEKIEGSNGEVKFASATFQLVEAPEFKVNVKQV